MNIGFGITLNCSYDSTDHVDDDSDDDDSDDDDSDDSDDDDSDDDDSDDDSDDDDSDSDDDSDDDTDSDDDNDEDDYTMIYCLFYHHDPSIDASLPSLLLSPIDGATDRVGSRPVAADEERRHGG